MTKEKHLYKFPFLFSLALLIINDAYLKYTYHNILTGKLSDFAGLFAFPYFFSCFFPKKVKSIYYGTGILFILWKSSYSQFFFDTLHNYGIGIDRVVDYSDLLALSILPVSYAYWKNAGIISSTTNKILKPSIVTISLFAFVATSLPRHIEKIGIKSGYTIEVPENYQLVKNKLRCYEASSQKPLAFYFTMPSGRKGADINTLIQIDSIALTKTEVTLDSILQFSLKGNGVLFFGTNYDQEEIRYVKSLQKEDFERLFEEEVKEQLKN